MKVVKMRKKDTTVHAGPLLLSVRGVSGGRAPVTDMTSRPSLLVVIGHNTKAAAFVVPLLAAKASTYIVRTRIT
jgi:hypothetical protein